MEDWSVELGKLCRKMHSGVFDCSPGEDIDLYEVMNDVYDNFTLISKLTIARLNNVGLKCNMISSSDLFTYERGVDLFVTFFRCMLKWCVGVDGIINESLVHYLTDVEIHFFTLAEYVLKFCIQGSDEDLRVLAKDEIHRQIKDTRHVAERVANDYSVVLKAGHSPSNFMISEELVVQFLDKVLVELNFSNYYSNQIEGLRDSLRFLRNYFQFSKEWINPEKLHELLIRVEAVVDKTACYSFLNFYRHNVEELFEKISNSIQSEMCTATLNVFVLRLDSNPPLTDELLMGFVDRLQENIKFLNYDIDLQGVIKDQVQFLQEVLRFLVHLLFSILPKYAEKEKVTDVKIKFQVVARDIGYAIISSFNNDVTGNAATNMRFGLSDSVEKVKLLKEHVVEIIVPVFLDRLRQKFPQTDQMGFLSFLLENMKELMDCKSALLMDSMDQVQKIHEELVLFRSFLQNFAGTGSKDISSSIMIVAYEAEYLTGTFVVGACPVEIKSLWISDLMEQIKLIKSAIAQIIERKADADEINDANKDPSPSIPNTIDAAKDPYHAPSQESVSKKDVVVGFEVEMELIKGQLTSDFKRLDVVSIIGMGGLGKTTLAKKAYDDPFIVEHFQLRAWCCVSQEYIKKELLLAILGSITELTDLIRRKSDGDLSVMLHQQLMGKRYLIVMDDVWGMEAFEDLKRFFPVNRNGSRVMLTSRNRLVGLEEKYHSNPLGLRFLTDDESWDLLKQKVYHREECPLQLCEVGKEIAEKCRGLPLAVVVVAGLLAKSDKNQHFWRKVAGNLSLYFAGDTQKQVMAALELSYNLLPSHLKPLFLYLGAFPEDNEIPAKKLMLLWISEGFVRRTELRSLEVEAEMNLTDLIDRSLLMVAERRSNGKVKACRVHDLLRDMCLRKAEEENFLQQIHLRSKLPDSIIYQRRLSICPQRKIEDIVNKAISSPSCTYENIRMFPIAHPLCSALLFKMTRDAYSWKKDIESALSNSKLLRVLHCESSSTGDYLIRNLSMLVHLKYIFIRTSQNSVPSSVSNLQNLESLHIIGLRGEIAVPKSIWEMVKLRHLHIDHWATFGDAVEESSKLENLQTLSTPALYLGDKDWLINRLPNLQKLRCIFMKGSYGNSYEYPELDSLDQLESLKVLYHGLPRPSGQRSNQFNLPCTLKKLSLSKFRLKWNDVSGLEKLLPNLEVLKLRVGAVDGELWDMGDVEYAKLKCLKLEALNIKRWIVSPENFPCLKKLVLQRCKQLEEIPSSVGDFYSLEKMEVLWCRPSAAKSAKEILEEQKDAGNELLDVHIYPPVLDL